MRVCLMIESQEDVTVEQWHALAAACEQNGLEGLFGSDHYFSVFEHRDRGSFDIWTVLAALAASTTRIRLGALVSPVTFRHPSVLAKAATTVDHLSAGRAELGLGGGWWEGEHRRYGFPFPTLGTRMEMLEEQVEIVHRAWTEDSVDFSGKHYRLEACPALPKPVQTPHPPLKVAGRGLQKTVRAAARFADEYNALPASPDDCREIRRRLDEAWEREGRDPTTLTFSVMVRCTVGADRAEADERIRRALARTGEVKDGPGPDDPWLAGTVEEVIEGIEAYTQAGVDRIYLQHIDHADVDMVEQIGRELVPAVSR
jgi:F420-dependent oxidoreductase-like protein